MQNNNNKQNTNNNQNSYKPNQSGRQNSNNKPRGQNPNQNGRPNGNNRPNTQKPNPNSGQNGNNNPNTNNQNQNTSQNSSRNSYRKRRNYGPRRNKPNMNQNSQTGQNNPQAKQAHQQTNGKPQSGNKSLTVCTLSGTDEVGRNCNFIELGDDILIIDAGFSFPGHEMYGIDYLIPNISYLKKNKHKIKGMLITHGHLDHTGALQYIMEDLGMPTIYAGAFANSLIEEKLKETPLKGKVKQVNVHRNTVMQFGKFKVTFIGVTHSIPNAFSIFIESPAGNVFFSGDYKIDQNPENELETDYKALENLRGKVDLALMESTNPEREGKAISAQEVAKNIEELVEKQEGRVVIAIFSSILSRLYSIIKIAEKTNRKIFISGRSLDTALKIARKHNYITYPDNLIVDVRQLKNYPDDKVLFVSTGSQGERYSSLNRISLGEHKQFKAKPGDLILLAASTIPPNIMQIEKMTDRLIGLGADIIQNGADAIHESGHALKMDMKMMFDMVQPKAVLPIHGSLTMRYKNKKNYVNWGLKEDDVYLTTDGQTWHFMGKRWRKGTIIESKPILIDGLGVGDIGEAVLKDREQLAEYGMVTVILNLSSKNHKLVGRPKFVSRGFVYVKTSRKLFGELEAIVVNMHKQWLAEGEKTKRHDTRNLLESIESSLSKYIYKVTEREPKILPVTI